MKDWTAGYMADIGYTYGYYGEMNPLSVQQAFLSNGLVMPHIGTACELGFGQGLTAVIHSAASPTTWYGTDFSPSQAASAAAMASASGSGAQLFDQSFEEFCSREDLPDFDFICMHGIWSWVSEENRRIILDFVRRKLKMGGVLYISYNCEVGWSSMAPMRRLMAEHAKQMTAPGVGVVPRVDAAVAFAEQLLESNPLYLRSHPGLKARIESLKGQDRHYLAHEYFNANWQPVSFSEMSEQLGQAKLEFACSAELLDNIPSIHCKPEQLALLDSLPHAGLREATRDFMIDRKFRRDFWVKGARKQSKLENLEASSQQRFILVCAPGDVGMKVKGYLGEAVLDARVYQPLLQAMADHQPKTVAQLAEAMQGNSINMTQLLESLIILVGNGALVAVQDDASRDQAAPHCDKLNAYLLSKARNSADIRYLASPVTGGAIPLDRVPMLFLYARRQGLHAPEQMAAFAADCMRLEKRGIVKDGKTYSSLPELTQLLQVEAERFLHDMLPKLAALHITS